MKLLVIRFSSIGDIILTTPVIRCIRQQLPGAELHYLTKSGFRGVIGNNPNLDKIWYLEDDLNGIIHDLKAEQFDYVIDLHHNLRSARVRQALGAESFSFPKLNIRKWMLVNLKINLMPPESIVTRYFETVKELGVKNDGQGLDYFIPESSRTTNDDIPMSHWAGYLGCIIGGSYATKKLPVEQWKKLLDLVPYPVILLGGADDRDEGQLIAGLDPVRIYNACGKFSISESAHLVQRARLIVSNDTGLMHIAAAFKKTIFSVWGNTAPSLGMFPYYGFNNLNTRLAPQSVMIEHQNLHCHPCSKLGYDRCPKGHFKCMKELDMESLAQEINRRWGG